MEHIEVLGITCCKHHAGVILVCVASQQKAERQQLKRDGGAPKLPCTAVLAPISSIQTSSAPHAGY